MPIVSGGAAVVVVDDQTPFLKPPGPSKLGVRHVWTGWDGSVWDLTNPVQGVVLSMDGVRGLTMPEVTHFRSQSPAVAGSRWRGSNTNDRSVFWPVAVFTADDASDQDWIDLKRAFMRTVRADKVGTWSVIQPTGEQRSLDLRYEAMADDTFARDPSKQGAAVLGINFNAEQPYWYGDPVVREFRQVTPAPFFSPSGSGSVVNIAPGSSISNAAMQNPGDVLGWVTWTLQGPFSSGTVGVDGVTIDVPFALTVAQSLTIYTSPDLMQAVDQDGNDRTDDLGPLSDFAGVEPGASVPLTLSLIGPTSDSYVGASLTPYYLEAL